MAIEVAPGAMSAEEIVALCRRHSLYEWSAQAAVDPIPVASAKGVHFFTPDGKRYIDFNSQLMSVNIGHGEKRVIDAIKAQADVLAYANPFMATEPRARLSAKTLHMKVDYNPYEGREVTGATDTVISRGKVVIDGGTFTGKAGAGSFLKRSTR